MKKLQLAIPEGRRPGKYLRQKAPDGYGQDFSSLVESLNYRVRIAQNLMDYAYALGDCHSCQSNSIMSREVYTDVWLKSKYVDLVIMVTPNGDFEGEIVARALINDKAMTYMPAYGKGHYMLDDRLRYAGFKPGQIIDDDSLSKLTTEAEQVVCHSYFLTKIPKSKVKRTSYTTYNPTSRYVKALHEYTECKIASPEKRAYMIKMAEWSEHEEQWLKEDLDDMKYSMHRWKQHCRIAGKPLNSVSVERKIMIHEPLENRYKLVKSEDKVVSSSLYDDYKEDFVKVEITIPDRFIPVNDDGDYE